MNMYLNQDVPVTNGSATLGIQASAAPFGNVHTLSGNRLLPETCIEQNSGNATLVIQTIPHIETSLKTVDANI